MAEEKEKNMFEISGGEVDRDLLLDIVAKNADGYAQWRLQKQPGKNAILKKNRQDAFNVDGFHKALSDITTAISEGKLKRGAGNVYVHSDGVVWEDPEHRAALDLINRGIDTIGKALPKEKKKYSKTGLFDRFNNKFYGGNFTGSEQDWEIWKNNPESVNNVILLLNEEYDSISNGDELDYADSPYKDRAEHLKRIDKLRQNLKNGVDETDYSDWVALGGDGEFFRNVTLLNVGSNNPYEKAWKEKELNYRNLGYTDEEIETFKNEFFTEQREQADTYKGVREAKAYQAAYDDFTKRNWTGSTKDITSLQLSNKYTDESEDLFFLGDPGLEEGGESKGWLANKSNQKYVDTLYGKLLRGESVIGASPDGVDNRRILKYTLNWKLENESDSFTPIEGNPDEYYINSSFNLKGGYAIKYNKNTGKITKVHVSASDTPVLLRKLQAMYKKNNPFSGANSPYGSILKQGGKVTLLQELRNIRKAQLGAKMAEDAELNIQNKYQQNLENEANKLYGSASDENISKVKLANLKAFTSEDTARKNGVVGGLDNSDWLRLASALTDVASIGVSYTGAGMPIAGLMQLGSTGMDLIADITDDTVTAGLVWKNLAMNVGLGAATAVGGGAVAKAGKIGKTIVKLLPVALAAYGANNLLEDEGFNRTLAKIKSGQFNKLTSLDLKHINLAAKIVSGGHHATKSAAGSIGTMYGKSSKVARGLGRWGTNAYTSKAKAFNALQAAKDPVTGKIDPTKLTVSLRNTLLYYTAIANDGFKPGAILTNTTGKITYGGVEVSAETAKAMEAARRTASTAADKQAAMLKVFEKSPEYQLMVRDGRIVPALAAVAEVNPNKLTASDAVSLENELKITDIAGNKGKLLGVDIDDINTNKFKLGDNEVVAKDIPAAAKAIYDGEIAAGRTHAEALASVLGVLNRALHVDGKTATEGNIASIFDFSKLVDNPVWYNPSRLWKRDPNLLEDTNPGWVSRQWQKISPDRADALDVNTSEGRANVLLLKLLRLFQDPNLKWANNTEYVNNFGSGFGGAMSRDIKPNLTAMREYGLALRAARLRAAQEARQQNTLQKQTLTLDQINQKIAAGESIRLTRELAKNPELLGKSLLAIAKYISLARRMKDYLNISDDASDSEVLRAVRIMKNTSGKSSLLELAKASHVNNFTLSNSRKSIIDTWEKTNRTRMPEIEKYKLALSYNRTEDLAKSILGTNQLNNQQEIALKMAIQSKISEGTYAGGNRSALTNAELKALFSNPDPKKGFSAYKAFLQANLERHTGQYLGGETSAPTMRTLGAPYFDLTNYSNLLGVLNPSAKNLMRNFGGKPLVPGSKEWTLATIKLPLNILPKLIWMNPYGEYAYWKKGGKVDLLKFLRTNFITDIHNPHNEMSKFKKGGIIKSQWGSDSSKWFEDSFDLKYLTGWNESLDASKAGESLSTNLSHNKYGTLQGAYEANLAYTGNSNLVGLDLNTYYNNRYKDYNLLAYVNAYNKDAKTISDRWTRNHSYGDTGATAHNLLFKAMFANRSGNTNEAYDLGYSDSSLDILGSTTWMRRMDRYNKKWNDSSLTDDERKKRIHEITLGDGSKGYVYKENDGTIGIVDNDTLSRLGYTTKTEDTKLPEGSSTGATRSSSSTGSTTSAGSTGDAGPAASTDNKFSKIGKLWLEGVPQLLAASRLALNLRNNKKLANLAKKKGVALLSPILMHKNVYGDFAALMAGNLQGAEIRSAANRIAEKTADADRAALIQLEGEIKAHAPEQEGRLRDNAAIAKSREELWELAQKVYDYNHKAADENMGRLVAKNNADIDVDMGLATANTTNWNNFLSGLEHDARTKSADQKARNHLLYQLYIQDWATSQIEDEHYLLLKDKYAATSDSKVYDELKKYKLQKTREIEPKLRLMKYNLLLGNYDMSVFDTPVGDYNMNGGYQMKHKKGGTIKIDSSRMKYRADDLRELRKQIRHNIETNRKALDNLSKATLLELKKMMGI